MIPARFPRIYLCRVVEDDVGKYVGLARSPRGTAESCAIDRSRKRGPSAVEVSRVINASRRALPRVLSHGLTLVRK